MNLRNRLTAYARHQREMSAVCRKHAADPLHVAFKARENGETSEAFIARMLDRAATAEAVTALVESHVLTMDILDESDAARAAGLFRDVHRAPTATGSQLTTVAAAEATETPDFTPPEGRAYCSECRGLRHSPFAPTWDCDHANKRCAAPCPTCGGAGMEPVSPKSAVGTIDHAES